MADDSMTKAELEEEARQKGVEVNSSMTKQEMIDAINSGGDSGGGDGGSEELSEGEARQLIKESGALQSAGHQSTVLVDQITSGDVSMEDVQASQEAPEEPEDTSQHGGLIQAPKTADES